MYSVALTNAQESTRFKHTSQAASSLRGIVIAELDTMVAKQIVNPVTEPIPWVPSMMVAQKKDSKVLIC